MSPDKQQIVDLETRFWRALQEKDVAGAQAMIADQSRSTGPSGITPMNPQRFGQLMRDAPWTLDDFEFSDMDVIFPTADVAVITYKVHQTGEMEGKPMDMNAAESTVWARDGDSWKCALHTETILQPQRQPEPA